MAIKGQTLSGDCGLRGGGGGRCGRGPSEAKRMKLRGEIETRDGS